MLYETGPRLLKTRVNSKNKHTYCYCVVKNSIIIVSFFSPAELMIDGAYQPCSIKCSSCEFRCEVKDCKRQVS